MQYPAHSMWFKIMQEEVALPAQLMPVAAEAQEVQPPVEGQQPSRPPADPSAQQPANPVRGVGAAEAPQTSASALPDPSHRQEGAVSGLGVPVPAAAPVAIKVTKASKAGGMRALLGRNKKASVPAAGILTRENGVAAPSSNLQVRLIVCHI